jgi:hypothetical protein
MQKHTSSSSFNFPVQITLGSRFDTELLFSRPYQKVWKVTFFETPYPHSHPHQTIIKKWSLPFLWRRLLISNILSPLSLSIPESWTSLFNTESFLSKSCKNSKKRIFLRDSRFTLFPPDRQAVKKRPFSHFFLLSFMNFNPLYNTESSFLSKNSKKKPFSATPWKQLIPNITPGRQKTTFFWSFIAFWYL